MTVDLIAPTVLDMDVAVSGPYVLLFPPDKTKVTGANLARLDLRGSEDAFVVASESDCNEFGLSPLDADLPRDYKYHNNKDNKILEVTRIS